MKIRKWTGIVLAVMLLGTVFTAGAATFTPGEYEASSQGFGGAVNVKLTVDEETITAIEITGEGELRLDREGLHFEGVNGGAPYSFFVPIRHLPTYGMCTDVSRFYTFVDGEFNEFYPERESAELWMMATEEMHRAQGGLWKDFPVQR